MKNGALRIVTTGTKNATGWGRAMLVPNALVSAYFCGSEGNHWSARLARQQQLPVQHEGYCRLANFPHPDFIHVDGEITIRTTKPSSNTGKFMQLVCCQPCNFFFKYPRYKNSCMPNVVPFQW